MAINRPSSFPRWGELVGNQGVTGPNETTPSSGKQDTGWIPGEEPPAQYFNWLSRLGYDWLQYLDVASACHAYEGFESTSFPPVNFAAPSVSYPSDLAYVRDTTSALVGSASANRPAGQGPSTNSSMSLVVGMLTPSRISFVFDVLCNNSNGDHLDFYIDGALTCKYSTINNTTNNAGRFLSDPLREGIHTFTWRFVRGASASVSGEKAKIDEVAVIGEGIWSASNRINFFDDFFYPGLTANQIPYSNQWNFLKTPDQPSTNPADGSLTNSKSFGAILLSCGNIGIGNSGGIITANCPAGNPAGPPNGGGWLVSGAYPFVEINVGFGGTTNFYWEFGVWYDSNNSAGVIVDTALSANFRAFSKLGGSASYGDYGFSPGTNNAYRIGVLGSPFGWQILLNGVSLPSAGVAGVTGNNFGGANGAIYTRVGSRVAAVTQIVYIDSIKGLGYRIGQLSDLPFPGW